LGPQATGRDEKFKTAFYRPLVSAIFPEAAPEKLEDSIRKARFGYYPPDAAIVRGGELGDTVFFLLCGRTRVDLPEEVAALREAMARVRPSEEAEEIYLA